jgi:uncharacterized sulfatase
MLLSFHILLTIPPKDLFDKYLKKGESKFVARYYAMVEWFDQTCGELFEELDNRGLSQEYHRDLRNR